MRCFKLGLFKLYQKARKQNPKTSLTQTGTITDSENLTMTETPESLNTEATDE